MPGSHCGSWRASAAQVASQSVSGGDGQLPAAHDGERGAALVAVGEAGREGLADRLEPGVDGALRGARQKNRTLVDSSAENAMMTAR